jgi:hypothetical protein
MLFYQMIWLGLAAAAVIAFFLNWQPSRSKGNRFDGVGFLQTWLLFGFVSLVVPAFIAGFNSAWWSNGSDVEPNEYNDKEQHSLQALATGDSSSGRFFLGSGYISGSQKFEYIIEDEDGRIFVRNVGTWQASVIEDEETEPYLQIEEAWVYNPDVLPWPVQREDRYTFHIPEGSVLSGYNISVGEGN